MRKNKMEKMEKILLGDEAIARGAIEAGIVVATTYPGTPASEIGDEFSKLAKEYNFYFEYGVNEKVAVETAAGASFFGSRSIVSFKQFGFNVASDSIFPLSFHGINGGMVIVVADDPQCWSSGQSEQDSRLFSRIAHMPMLEPSSVQECKDFVISAFEISEKLKIPVIIRVTTRSCYAAGVVKLGKIRKIKNRKIRRQRQVSLGEFKESAWNNMPPKIVEVHKNLHEKLKIAEKLSEKFCTIEGEKKDKEGIGIIVSGIPYLYVKEILEDKDFKEKKSAIQVLKIGMWPYPRNTIKRFLTGKEKILVIEEIEGILEEEIKRIAYEENLKIEIFGKNVLQYYGELKINDVESAMRKVVGLKEKKYPERIDVIPRRPVLCPGCPHRATFYEVKKIFGNSIYCGDVGCYILGMFKPLETQDFIISMGASEGIAHGIKKVNDNYTIAFIGDSTFFHAGIPGLINIVYNRNYNIKNNPLVVIMDNKVTAMTGHQPHPGTGITGMGNKVNEIKIEEILKFCKVMKIDPFNYRESLEKIKEARNLLKDEPQVIISERECRLNFMRRARREGIKIPIFQIDKGKCKKCEECIKFGCPAIHKDEEGIPYIDESWCWGCSVCAQICPYDAISAVSTKIPR